MLLYILTEVGRVFKRLSVTLHHNNVVLVDTVDIELVSLALVCNTDLINFETDQCFGIFLHASYN